MHWSRLLDVPIAGVIVVNSTATKAAAKVRRAQTCTDGSEMSALAALPRGFLARLDRGERPAWLEPIAIPGSPIRVWRVRSESRPRIVQPGLSAAHPPL